MEKTEIKGKVVFQRSEDDDDGKCVCCEGKHIFSRYIDWDNNIELRDLIWKFTENKEGKRVKLTIEVEE